MRRARRARVWPVSRSRGLGDVYKRQVEAVLQRNPEVILSSDQAQLEAWKAWPQVAAVKQQQLRLVTDKGLERPSGQMVEATAKLCQLIDPER